MYFNLIGIVVSVDVYSPYKFLIAEKEGEYQIIVRFAVRILVDNCKLGVILVTWYIAFSTFVKFSVFFVFVLIAK